MNRRIAMLLTVLLITACSPLTPRRLTLVGNQWTPQRQEPVFELADEDINPTRATDAAKSISSTTWEHYHSFDVGIIEFTERGALWGIEQRKQVMDNIRRLAAERGVTLVVYAHGWHHSARWNDTNLVSFRRVLRFLAKRPAGMHCPAASSPTNSSRVVGVYIGWRGESIPVPGLNLTTIWSRKRIAQRIGGPATDQEERSVKYHLQTRSELSNVLRELDGIRAKANETALAGGRPFSSLTITGHSLGGAMLLSAMQQIVFQKTIDHALPIDQAELQRIGDAVILLNPAVEARRYKSFRAELAKTFDGRQRPILMVLSSAGDWPNRIALKVARFFVTLGAPPRWREWHDSTTALGFSTFDISHKLVTDDEAALVSDLDKLIPASYPEGFDDNMAEPEKFDLTGTLKYGDLLRLERLGKRQYTPFLIVNSDKKVIKDHNDIFSAGVLSFVVPFVRASERKGLLPLCRTQLAMGAPAAK
jgi:hypothetical protein